MAEKIQLAGDASFFVLDDTGVFFSESNQELYLFNTPATYVWCCMEEGYGAMDVFAMYAKAFNMEQEQAEQQVAELLHKWQGLGFISGVDGVKPPEIDLITALGRLLVNPSIRQDFITSPADVAARLGVSKADMEAFRHLDPAGLIKHAEILKMRKIAWREWRERKRLKPLDLRKRVSLRTGQEHCANSGQAVRKYVLGGIVFQINFETSELEETIHPIFSHLEVEQSMVAGDTLELLKGSGKYFVLHNNSLVAQCLQLSQLPPLVKSEVRSMVVGHGDFFMEFHAAAIFNGEKCLMLPGASGSGKTTLSAALAQSGYMFFSDETSLLEENSLWLRPVPLSLTIKPGALVPLTAYYQSLPELPVYQREDQQHVRYLPPPPEAVSSDFLKSAPVGWVVFPFYSPGVETALRPLKKNDALCRMMQESRTVGQLLDKQKVARLIQWIRIVECYELTIASLDSAVSEINRLTGHDCQHHG